MSDVIWVYAMEWFHNVHKIQNTVLSVVTDAYGF